MWGASGPAGVAGAGAAAVASGRAVLRGIDVAKSRGLKADELKKTIAELLRKYMPDPNSAEFARVDMVSHHILRLAFCGTEEKRRWMATQESHLFRWRLEELDPEAVSAFVGHEGLAYPLVSARERSELLSELLSVALAGVSSRGVGAAEERALSMEVMKSAFYKVPFIEALELVGRRRVLLKGGMAFVMGGDMASILVGRFRAKLSRALAMAARALPAILTDERLAPVLGSMSQAYLGSDWGSGNAGAMADSERLRVGEVDAAARASFPLCMQSMVEHIKAHKHVTHWGRLQLGLFLKGCGLSVEESLHWWQEEFRSPQISPEEFIKRYAYNIRHMYGKEGKRTDYTPYSCQKIILGTPPGNARDAHGCPFRHWDVPRLRAHLQRAGVAGAQLEDILDSVRTKDFQIACRKEFKARHNGLMAEEVGEHPNTYFVESRKILIARAAAASAAAPSPGAASAGGAAAAAAAATAPAPASFAASSSAMDADE